MNQLIRFGEIRRGVLGVVIQDLTPDLAEALGTDATRGAVVTEIQPNSPAEDAGLRAGDVIVSAGGKDIENSSDLRNRVGLIPVGQDVELTIIRDGKRRRVRTRVAEAGGDTATGGKDVSQLEGALFQDIQPGTKLYGKVNGVLVAEVEQGSVAWRYGLRPGDIVVGVNREQVASVGELTNVLSKGKRTIALNVVRGNSRVFIVIR